MMRLTSSSLPGMGVAEKHDRVAGRDLELRVLVGGQARQHGGRLALAAGADDDDLVAAAGCSSPTCVKQISGETSR